MNKREWFQSILLTLFCFILTVGLLICLVWLVSFFSKPISIYMLILSVAGGFGGLCYSLLEKGRIKLCRFSLDNDEKDKKPGLDLGSIADILIGVGSAFAIFLVLSGLVALTNKLENVEPSTIFVLASLGIVAGAGGKVLFPILVDKLAKMTQAQITAERAEEKATEAKDKAVDAILSARILQGNSYLTKGELTQAETIYLDVLKENPRSAKALVGLAVVKSKRKDYANAINLCTSAIEINPNYADAYYNRACNRSLSGQPLDEILDDLRKAIDLDKSFREEAEKDEDFKSIKGNKEFLEIVSAGK